MSAPTRQPPERGTPDRESSEGQAPTAPVEPKAIVGGGWQKPTAPPIASQTQMPGLPPVIRQLAERPPKLAVSPPKDKE